MSEDPCFQRMESVAAETQKRRLSATVAAHTVLMEEPFLPATGVSTFTLKLQ